MVHESRCRKTALFAARDTAEALSLSIRSIDYLITTGRLPVRRVGGKILIPASAVRRFAREDLPDSVRAAAPDGSKHANGGRHFSGLLASRFHAQREGLDDAGNVNINGSE